MSNNKITSKTKPRTHFLFTVKKRMIAITTSRRGTRTPARITVVLEEDVDTGATVVFTRGVVVGSGVVWGEDGNEVT